MINMITQKKLKDFNHELLKRSERIPEEEDIQNSNRFISLFGDKK